MTVAAAAPRRWKKPPMIQRAWLRWSLALGAAIYLALALGTTEVNWTRVWEGLPRGVQVLRGVLPAGFRQPLERDRRGHRWKASG